MLHVVATGGEVAAVLDDTWLDGVIPRGGDDATPAAAPALEQVIPAFRVGGPAIVRVAVPGADEAVVQTRVLTPAGPRPIPRDAVVRVAGQSSRDIDVSALPAGAYAVQVRADVPVVAAAMTERRRKASGPSDLAWATSTPAIGQLAGSVLRNQGTKGVSASLDLAATGGPGSAVVTVVDTKGAGHDPHRRRARRRCRVGPARRSHLGVGPPGRGHRPGGCHLVEDRPARGPDQQHAAAGPAADRAADAGARAAGLTRTAAGRQTLPLGRPTAAGPGLATATARRALVRARRSRTRGRARAGRPRASPPPARRPRR